MKKREMRSKTTVPIIQATYCRESWIQSAERELNIINNNIVNYIINYITGEKCLKGQLY